MFTAERRQRILTLLQAGASRRAAARASGIDPSTLCRWIRRGERAHPESRYRSFVEEVLAAEAGLRAPQAVYDAMPGDPSLAWRYVERQEPGYAAPDDPDDGHVITLRIDG
jgi:Homeodomain-like domain